MAQIEVPIISSRRVSTNAPPVTDVDVLGFRPSAELKWQLVIGDCKTRRRESPVNRVLWVRGLQEHLGAASSIVILKRDANAQIERDHKLFADKLGVLLIQEDEFSVYDRAVVYPAGSAGYVESAEALASIRHGIPDKFPALREFVQWVMCDAWAIGDHTIVLRRLLGKVRDVRGELDPRRDDHLALILETLSAVAIPLATLVGDVFRGHLKPDQRAALEDAVRVIVWGGRDQYEFFNALRRQVIAAKGGDPQETLALPAWDQFLELLRGYLEAPHLAFRTPQLLRSVAAGLITGTLGDVLSRVDNHMLLHLTLKLALYVCRAGELPQDAAERLKRIFTPRITELVQAPTTPSRSLQKQTELPIEPTREENSKS
jgi:hypothetical protein